MKKTVRPTNPHTRCCVPRPDGLKYFLRYDISISDPVPGHNGDPVFLFLPEFSQHCAANDQNCTDKLYRSQDLVQKNR